MVDIQGSSSNHTVNRFVMRKKGKQEPLLLNGCFQKVHLKRFRGRDDAKEIWAAIKTSLEKIRVMNRGFKKTTITVDALGAVWCQLKMQIRSFEVLPPACGTTSKRTSSFPGIEERGFSITSQSLFKQQSQATAQEVICYIPLTLPKQNKCTPGLALYVIHSFLATTADDAEGPEWMEKWHVPFVREKLSDSIATILAFCRGVQVLKVQKEGSRQEAKYEVQILSGEIEKGCLMTIDEGQSIRECKFKGSKEAVKKLESQLKASHKQQSSLTEKLNFQANQIFEKDEKLKKYRRIGMKAVKDKDALQQIFNSWFASSKNLWKLVDCGMSSTVKIGLGYGIKSNAEVLGYEEEISRGIFAFRETNAGYNDIPLYSRFKQVEYKGVPHPLSGDYTPREQEDIDDSLYEYGKYGPQPQSPSPTESDASSTVYSTCQSNDSDGEQGTVSDHSVNDDPIPIPSIEQVTIATQKTQPQVPKPQQTVDPSCAQHVKTPRQPIRTPVTPSPIPSYNRQNWNQRMKRDLGTGYSFERKPCFVCGSLSHLIKDCDYYEKKMAREAAFKSTRVVHANVRQATPAWTNSNRVNKANQFTPRPVQLNNIRPNLSTASNTIKTGRVNVNTGHGNVSSVSSAGTQFKSGASRFNTGKQHVNSGRMYVNSGTQNKSGGSRVNTGKQNVNSGRVHVNTARVNRPVLSNQTSQVNLKSPKKCFSKQSSPVNRPFSRNTAYKSNIYAVKGKMGTAVKTSAGCVWRKTTPHSNTNSGPTPDSYVHDHPLKHMEHRGIFDSGCSGHMTGNRAHLEDYQELSKVGSVTFGGSKGKICDKKLKCNFLLNKSVCGVPELQDADEFSLLGKFDGKSDEGLLVGYSVNSKAFRVYNLVTKRVEVNLHVNFIEENPMYRELALGFKGIVIDIICQIEVCMRPNGGFLLHLRSEKIATKMISLPQGQPSSTQYPIPTTVPTSTNPVNTGSINLNTAFEEVNTGNTEAISPSADHEEEVFSDADDDEMPEIRIYDKSSEGIFEKASYDDEGIISDFNNLPDEKLFKKITEAHALVSYIQAHQRSNHKDQQHCLFACFLSQFEPRKVSEALEDGSWVEAMQEELLQFKLQQGSCCQKQSIGSVAQGHKTEEGIDYDEVYKIKQNKEGIFIYQDKYVAEILMKFDLCMSKLLSLPMETKLPLTNYEEVLMLDLHLYRIYDRFLCNSKTSLYQCGQEDLQSTQRAQPNWDYGILGVSTLDLGKHSLMVTFVVQILTGNPQQSAVASTREDGSLEISATVDTKRNFNVTNDDLFEGMGQIGYPTDGTFTFWKSFYNQMGYLVLQSFCTSLSSKSRVDGDHFGSNIATALICLSTGQEHAAQAQTQPIPPPPPIPSPTPTPPYLQTSTSLPQIISSPTPPLSLHRPSPPPPPHETRTSIDEHFYEGNAMVKLVKKGEECLDNGFLKRRNLVLTDSEDEVNRMVQGRKRQADRSHNSLKQGTGYTSTTKDMLRGGNKRKK
ncbi:putative ribonuclease H-like domain-containing protein [Tanacetum coccineum]